MGSIPGQGANILNTTWQKKKKAGAGERKEGKEKQEENRKGEVSDY